MPSVAEAALALWMAEHSLQHREPCVPLWLQLPPPGGQSLSQELFLEGTGLRILKFIVYHLGSSRRIDVDPPLPGFGDW